MFFDAAALEHQIDLLHSLGQQRFQTSTVPSLEVVVRNFSLIRRSHWPFGVKTFDFLWPISTRSTSSGSRFFCWA